MVNEQAKNEKNESPRGGRKHGQHNWRVIAPALVASTAIVATAAVSIVSQVKVVEINDAGVTRSVTTTAGNVSQILASQGVTVGEHDTVTPALNSSVTNGGEIRILRAKPAAMERGEQSWTSWVAGRTLQQQLDSLTTPQAGGLGMAANASQGVYMMADRTGYLPVADHAAKVVVQHDKRITTMTVAANDDLVRALGREGIQLRPLDSLSVARNADGSFAVRVQRVERKNVAKVTELPFKTEKKDDKELPKGKTEIKQKGVAGQQELVEYQETVDGKVTFSYVVSNHVTKQPVNQIEIVGVGDPVELAAKEAREKGTAAAATGDSKDGAVANAPAAPANPTGAQAIARDILAGQGMGADQFGCLVQLWNHESGWNHTAMNSSSGAYGIPQALPGSKMASAGADWQTNPATQIKWGLGYIAERYGTPCGALGAWQSKGWY